jgi:putative (di)nucleoside polyphosphate hydrolase
VIIPSLFLLDKIRASGFRPQIVGCLLDNKKILFVYKQEHDLWQLPQGGIDNFETLEEAFAREMREELGLKFTASSEKGVVVVGESKVKFPDPKESQRELKTDAGKEVFMIGKKYFFVAAPTKAEVFNLSKSEFDDFKWLTYDEAIDLCEIIYQKGKKRVTLNALKKLREANFL